MKVEDIEVGAKVLIDGKTKGTVRANGFHGAERKVDVVIHHPGHAQDGYQLSVKPEQITLQPEEKDEKPTRAKAAKEDE